MLNRWQLSLVIWLVASVLSACACAASRLRLALRRPERGEFVAHAKRNAAAAAAAEGAMEAERETEAESGREAGQLSLPGRAFAAHVSLLASRPRLVVLLHVAAVAACMAVLVASGGFGIETASSLAYVVFVGREADEGDMYSDAMARQDRPPAAALSGVRERAHRGENAAALVFLWRDGSRTRDLLTAATLRQMCLVENVLLETPGSTKARASRPSPPVPLPPPAPTFAPHPHPAPERPPPLPQCVLAP